MSKIKVKEIMSTELITVRKDDPIATFEAYFKGRKIHHLLVENENGKLEGIISSEDAARAMSWVTKDKVVAEHIMSKDPITINENMPIKIAKSHFLENRYRALPVINEDQILVGIITPYDLLQKLKLKD